MRSCPAAEQAPDQPDLYAAIRRDQKWRGRAERRFKRTLVRPVPRRSVTTVSGAPYPWPVTATSPEWPLPGDPDASVGARHHRVPRFYLERFANERMQIATVDRRTRARRTA